jgi:hypothetical protein
VKERMRRNLAVFTSPILIEPQKYRAFKRAITLNSVFMGIPLTGEITSGRLSGGAFVVRTISYDEETLFLEA